MASDSNKHQSTRIIFGSCSKPYLEQPLWPHIISREPNLFLWTGDIVYHDRPDRDCSNSIYDYLDPYNVDVDSLHCRRFGFGAIRPDEYDSNYALQLQNPKYQQLMNNNKTKILGIWDDHDFGRLYRCFLICMY